MFTTFVVSKDKRLLTYCFTQNFIKMDTAKFIQEVAFVVELLIKQRQMTDKSDKRIVRDTIRAIVKELTRV